MILESVTVHSVTLEELAELDAQKYNISKDEAMRKLGSERSRSSVVGRIEFVKTYVNNTDFKIRMGATFKLEGYGNYYDITDSYSPYSNYYGTVSYGDWEQSQCYIPTLTGSYAVLNRSGHFTSSVSISGFILGTNALYHGPTVDFSQTITSEMLKTATDVPIG